MDMASRGGGMKHKQAQLPDVRLHTIQYELAWQG